MSSSKSLIINCGASHVSAAVFSARGSQLVLEDLVTDELKYDFAQEDQWLPAVTTSLRTVLSQRKLRGNATLILPSYLLLTKPIKVPHVEASKQAQIIAFEAQQAIPYPLTEVVWGSQVVADDGVETEVVLIAVKSDIAERFCGYATGVGLVPVGLEASSILDYNAYRYAYADSTEETLLINVGARSSNLMFIGQNGFYVRTIALGGNSLTQNLADNLGKGFAQAETVKVAFFSGQSRVSNEDPAVQILQNTAQMFMKRLSQEITRSIVNYRRQNAGRAPARILLTGRGSLLPGLSEHLAETQKMAVDYFNPTQGLALGAGVTHDSLAGVQTQLSEVVGQAARLVLPQGVGINLLPAPVAERIAFRARKPFLFVAAACLALAPLPVVLNEVGQANQLELTLGAMKAKTRPLESLQSRIADTRRDAQAIRDQISQIESLVNTKSNWITFFTEIQDRLTQVKDVWLEDLKVVRERPAATQSDGGLGGDGLGGEAAPAALPPPTYHVLVSGRMLLRDFDPNNPGEFQKRATQRINRLFEGITDSQFIEKVEGESYDFSDRRILRFRVTLVVNPSKPL